MSLAIVFCRSLLGIDAPEVMVEVHLGRGLPAFNLVGLPEASVKEAKERKKPDEHSLRVFDLDKKEWRSFRFDRLQKVSTEIVFGTK